MKTMKELHEGAHRDAAKAALARIDATAQRVAAEMSGLACFAGFIGDGGRYEPHQVETGVAWMGAPMIAEKSYMVALALEAERERLIGGGE